MNLKEGLLKKMIRVARTTAPVWDIVFSPMTLVAAIWFRIVRYWGVKNMTLTQKIFLKTGMFPIVDHYYEPLFDSRKIGLGAQKVSHLDFNDPLQLKYAGEYGYGGELRMLPQTGGKDATQYYYRNGSFESGDAELYYSIIRSIKPAQILEIGSGFSTLIAIKAIETNRTEDPGYRCDLICVEPYEMPQLDQLNINIIRKKIEDVDPAIFASLKRNDILFIDSSHIIRPGGDVTYLLLKIVPQISQGVWVHVHDVFLPRDYPLAWLRDEYRMWNEQYLLEALLTANNEFEIVFALNYLKHKYPQQLATAFPVLAGQPEREPASFWIRRK